MINLYQGTGLEGYGPLGLVGQSATNAPTLFTQVITSTIGLLTIIAFIWFFIQLFIGGLSILTAGSDKNKVSEGITKIRNSLLGLVVVIFAVSLANIVGYVFDVDFLFLTDLISRI